MRDDAVILVAEDDAGHFVLVKKNLWRSCVTNDIFHFKDGQEVLDFLFQTGDGNKLVEGTPYLLLLDIRMPKVDGLEVLAQLRADEQLKKMPVIILTTTDEAEEVDRCYDLGCSFYIVKPANYNDFMSTVEQLGAFLSLPGVKFPTLNEANTNKETLGVDVK